METLVKNSSIGVQKTRFFVQRAVIYSTFLLLPVWVQKSMELPLVAQTLLMVAYLMFMAGQWYLLGKEFDHRFKIYFRANSSFDRILYRLIVGSSCMMLIFNFISFMPEPWVRHFFWGWFAFLGLYYSWPTRGKIIQESVSTQFTEYRYLDSFEKTVLLLILLLILASIPSFPFFQNLETYKLIVDPDDKMNYQFWSYINLLFHPFRRFPHLVNLGWNMYFYIIGMIFYMLSCYGIFRFFYSRRLSIFGVFALVSTWSFSLFLRRDIFSCFNTTFSVIWVWSILWCMRSATYRSGLMYGLLCYVGVIINYNFVFLFPVGALLFYFFFQRDQTTWYRQQWIKYTSLGLILILVTLVTHLELSFFDETFSVNSIKTYFLSTIQRKAFYVLFWGGAILSGVMIFTPHLKALKLFVFDRERLIYIWILFLSMILISLFIEKNVVVMFGALWMIVFVALLPLEWIFQSINRLRLKRNIIFVTYVLVCLLDSHFDGRVRSIIKFFKEPVERFLPLSQ